MRYIDLNPVRARMTEDPVAFAWSSCAALCGRREDPLLTLHPAKHALGAADAERAEAYRILLTAALNNEELAAIRLYLKQQCAYGRDDFQAMVEAKTRRFAGVRPAHRPGCLPSGPSEPEPVFKCGAVQPDPIFGSACLRQRADSALRKALTMIRRSSRSHPRAPLFAK